MVGRSQVVEIGEQQIHLKIVGEGEPVLCLSGFGCDHYNYQRLAPILAKEFQLYLVDNRGTGQSAPVQEDYSIECLAKDALRVMEYFGHRRFHMIGISMGGFIAQKLALLAPTKIQSLGLLCTTSGGPEFIPLPEMDEAYLKSFYSLPEPKRSEVAVSATVHPTLLERDPKLFQSIVRLRMGHPMAIDQILRQKRAVDDFLESEIELEKIVIPTLVLSGKEDRFVDTKNAEILGRKIPQAAVRFIEESDHLFFLEKACEVAEELGLFLKSSEVRRR